MHVFNDIIEIINLLLVMELWRLRAREFLSARSTLDNREDEREGSLAEALSSSNSAPMNWRRERGQDKGNDTVRNRMEHRGTSVQMSFCFDLSPARPQGEPWAWLPGSDQVWRPSAPRRSRRCGVPPSPQCCRTRACEGEKHKANLLLMLHVIFFFSNPEVITEIGALRVE